LLLLLWRFGKFYALGCGVGSAVYGDMDMERYGCLGRIFKGLRLMT